MAKLNIGIGDDFPVNDAAGTEHLSCEQMRAYWAARREARHARWRQWCAQWRTSRDPQKAPQPNSQDGDASYTDVPPYNDRKA